MSVQREKDKWQRFIDLLPDPERRDELVPILDKVERSGANMDHIYSAIRSGLNAKPLEEQAQRVLTASKPFVRKIDRASKRIEAAEKYFTDLTKSLDPEKKAAFRHLHQHTTEPYDLALQRLREAKEILKTQVLPEAKIGRPDGHQPHEYARRTDAALHAAGIGSKMYRDDLLRVYDLKPHVPPPIPSA
jgi:hypothetical protein